MPEAVPPSPSSIERYKIMDELHLQTWGQKETETLN